MRYNAMSGRIFTRPIGKRDYVYFQHSYRVKINPKDKGATRNTGKSKVTTETIYLGSVEEVKEKCLRKEKYAEETAAEYDLCNFGLEAAAYSIIEEFNLSQLLQKSFPGYVNGVSVCNYLITAIIHRISETKPKTKINEYVQKSVLNRILKFDADVLTSGNYWLAYEKIISEKKLEIKRKEIQVLQSKPQTDEMKKTIKKKEIQYSTVKSIDKFQTAFFDIIQKIEKIHCDNLYIDATNFYNYIDNLNGQSLFCVKGNNKAGKKKLNQINMMNAATVDYGIPILTEIYKGNLNDVTLFPEFLTKLINNYVELKKHSKTLYICFDKGNNSNDNYQSIKKIADKNNIKIRIVGSLTPKYHQELLDIPLNKFSGKFGNYLYYSTKKDVFGANQRIVVTYHIDRKKRERRLLDYRLQKYSRKIQEYFGGLKDSTKEKMTIEELKQYVETNIVKHNPYKEIIELNLENKTSTTVLKITLNKIRLNAEYKQHGKTILFCNTAALSENEILETYHGKYKVDYIHKLLKCPDGVLFHPNWVWTDSKLKIQAFVNIIALTILKLMEKRYNEKQKLYSLNATAIKAVLKEIKLVLALKNETEAEPAVGKLSALQQSVFDVFNLKRFVKLS